MEAKSPRKPIDFEALQRERDEIEARLAEINAEFERRSAGHDTPITRTTLYGTPVASTETTASPFTVGNHL